MKDEEKIFLICDFFDPAFCSALSRDPGVVSLIDPSLNDDIAYCHACGGCNFKTPGVCQINDPCQHSAKAIGECTTMIVISKNTFGCYSPFVKKVIERCIGYISVFFKTRLNAKGTKHFKRYRNQFQMVNLFYGESSEQEKKTAKALAEQTAYLLNAKHCTVIEKKTAEACMEYVKRAYFTLPEKTKDEQCPKPSSARRP